MSRDPSLFRFAGVIAANGRLNLPLQCEFFRIVNADNGAGGGQGELDVWINAVGPVRLRAGDGYRVAPGDEPITLLAFGDASGLGSSFQIIYGFGDFQHGQIYAALDQAPLFEQVTGQPQAVNSVTLPNGAAGALLAIGTQGWRVGAWFKADVANTVTVWIGAESVAVDRGFPLAPGESIFLPFTHGGVSGFAAAANQKVHVLHSEV